MFNSYLIGGAFEIELLPGRHTLIVGYYEERYVGVRGTEYKYSTSPQVLEFEATAGRKYTIEAEVDVLGKKWEAKIVEVY